MHEVIHRTLDGGRFIGGGHGARTGVNQISVAVDAGHLAFGQRCMDHLSGLAGWLDARRGVTALARHVALRSHGVVHFLRELAAASIPCFVVVEVGRHLLDNIANASFDVGIGLHEPIVHRNVALATARPDTRAVADMRRLEVVRVGRRIGMWVGRTAMVVAGRAELIGRCVFVDLYRSDRRTGTDEGAPNQDQDEAPRDGFERQISAEDSHDAPRH